MLLVPHLSHITDMGIDVAVGFLHLSNERIEVIGDREIIAAPSGDNQEDTTLPDTYTQVMEQGNGAQCKRPLRPSERVSSRAIRSAIREEDHFCGRGSRQSGQWCATNLLQ